LVLALAAGDRVGRALGVRRAVAVALIVSFGIIVSATLTPLGGVVDVGAAGTGSCDVTRSGLPRLGELLAISDTSLNVLLFVPLGVCIAFIPRSRTRVLVVVAAIALPFAIEATQLLVPLLGRGCESADVVDNLIGLAIGLAIGLVAGWLLPGVRRSER
jgi:hypothetical protein